MPAKTTQIRWDELFDIDEETMRIIAIGGSSAIAHNLKYGEAIAAVFRLLDQKSKTPTGKTLFVGMSPATAVHLANAILAHAKKRRWPVRPSTSQETAFIPPKGTTH